MTPPRIVVIALRLLLGGLFIYASLSKIADPAAFTDHPERWLVETCPRRRWVASPGGDE